MRGDHLTGEIPSPSERACEAVYPLRLRLRARQLRQVLSAAGSQSLERAECGTVVSCRVHAMWAACDTFLGSCESPVRCGLGTAVISKASSAKQRSQLRLVLGSPCSSSPARVYRDIPMLGSGRRKLRRRAVHG